MARPIAYDITRLAARVLSRTPNGIDRVDLGFARHFLDLGRAGSFGLMMALLGPRVFSGASARDVVEGISQHWGEAEPPGQDEAYRKIAAWIGGIGKKPSAAQRLAQGRTGRARGVWRWIARHGVPLGQPPAKALPKGAIYLNVSQFPIWIESYFGFLRERADIKPVFFVHDLLPIEMPEYFPKDEFARHVRRIRNVARFGAGAIVATEAVALALKEELARLGRLGLPVHVAPIPAEPIFFRREAVDDALKKHPYFVVCGTIEPRKNHLMLLHVWRELVGLEGEAAPKLVLVGKRGWENENVADLLDRCRALGNHVIEVGGLSTPSLKRLLDGACALLMPSFAEGYGLPLVEARAAGVPVIASNLPVFREICGDEMTAISPIDGAAWLAAVRASTRCRTATRQQQREWPTWGTYFDGIERFLASL